MQMGQLEPIVNKVDSPGRDLQMGLLSPIFSDPLPQQRAILNDQFRLLRTGNPASQGLSMSMMRSGTVESRMNNPGMHQAFVPNKQYMQMETMLISMGPQQISTTPKRKSPMEPLPCSSLLFNKRVAQIEHRPWLQQVSTSNKGALQSTVAGPQHLPVSSKRRTQMESSSSKSGGTRFLNSRSQSAQVQQSAKVQIESAESIRSKMRESLVAALAFVLQQDKPQTGNSNASNEAANVQGKVESTSQCAASGLTATDATQGQRQETTQSVYSSSTATSSVDSVIGEQKMTSASTGDFSIENFKDGVAELPNISINENILNSVQGFQYGRQDFTTDDVPFSENFFIKDELLQGNGLSWELESDIQMTNQKENQTNEEQRLEPEEVGGSCKKPAVHSPELWAARIEAELFKLFGGVSKKYKEKGRSLLFNLKDRNNPELRERIMSGEILPERLCSMTAEELASKELSQWRIAKAEELAQMVVLRNPDVDVRRLVKKTHKGEYQVEVEHDDSISVEVSGGVNSAATNQTKRKDAEASAPPKPDGINGDLSTDDKKGNVDKDDSCAQTSPSNDGTDLMQGLMADDALKDADFLGPIVSLDEFMESLDSEPPFENLSLIPGRATPNSDKDGSESKYSGLTPSDHVDGNPDKSPNLEKRVDAESGVVPSDARSSEIDAGLKLINDHTDKKLTDYHAEVRLTGDTQAGSRRTELKASQNYAEEIYSGSQLYSKTAVPTVVPKGECIWEGMLQLIISDTLPVMGIFKSGERTSVKDWPGLLEIKGRVRLDAFEKFLQELPLSRTRAVMVVHFVSKESSSKNDQSILRQVADSYILDARVGFAEPIPQVELYFCPPLNKTIEILSKIISKEQVQALNAIDFGLIGVVVWRKNHLNSTILPTSSSSQHKNSSKWQYFSSRRQQDTNTNSNLTPKPSHSTGFKTTQIEPPSDDDDDIPPGFGPAVPRDLPEFIFSGGPNRSMSPLIQNAKLVGPGMTPFYSSNQTSRPLEQVRELIQKYGENQTIASPRNWNDRFGVTIQPWNDDDDDDDIPEWQPHNLQNQFSLRQKNLEIGPHILNHSYGISSHNPLPMESLQPPMNVTQNIRSLRDFTTQGNNLNPSNFNYRAPAQGIAWRPNFPPSRGF